MGRGLRWLSMGVTLALFLGACGQAGRVSSPLGYAPPAQPLRTARLVVANDALWAGHPASRTVTRLRLPDGRVAWQTSLGCEPATLARSELRLFVTCFDSGEVAVLEDQTGKVIQRRWIGRGPFGLLAHADRLYVTLAHDNALVVLHPNSLKEVARATSGRQPRGVALEGDRLYVVHLLDGATQVFDARTLGRLGEVQIGQQAGVAESITLSWNGRRAYVPHQRMNVTNMARTFESTVFPLVNTLDTEQLAPIRKEALALDSVDTPVGMPIAVALSPDGARLFAANAASDDISVVDLSLGIGAGHVAVGHHPRDLALSPDGKLLYTLNLVSDDISVVDTDRVAVIAKLPLANDPRPAEVQQGERLFFTSRPEGVSRDRWMACASCHLDAGSDGQTWLGNAGGPRNTPILRGIGGTEPFHWSADRPDIQSFQKTFTGIMAGKGLSPAELDSLAAYLNSLPPLPSPVRKPDKSLLRLAKKGAEVFVQAGCAVCHSPPLFTDRNLHDVGTGEPFHKHPLASGNVPETMGPLFDTPSLRELWLTASYLHDGRASTLRDVLTTFNSADRHGRTSTLTERELAALEAFLLSLPLTSDELERLFKK